MQKLTRDIYRPTADRGYEAFKPEGIELPEGVEIYINTDRCAAMFFSGKRAKPDWHYRYGNAAKMHKAITDSIQSCNERAERKAAQRKEKAAWVHDVKVGDVFRCSWGYDQTNIDYYEVTALIGKTMCDVRELKQEIHETEFMQGKCIPTPGKYAMEADYSKEKENGVYPMKEKAPRRMRIQQCSETNPCLAVYKFANAYRVQPQEIAPGVKVFPADHWTAYA
jgi:hypothetical protein